MNLHEYQAKKLFSQYGLPILNSRTVDSLEQVVPAVSLLKTPNIMVKAQVHAGGRGKAGGVQVAHSQEQVIEAVGKLLHSKLVTYQSNGQGLPVNHILLEETCEFKRELYFSMLIDRASQQVVFMVSTEGGVDIEKVAAKTPHKILKQEIDPLLGVMPYQCRALGLKLELNNEQISQLTIMMCNFYKMFIECDLSLIEVNPLVVTKTGQLVCLDAKVNIDDNALYRQPVLADMRDTTQEDEKELHARHWELNYISLEGDIGCMVNGAGLAMATMDIIKLKGGNPANFLDVGGGATEDRVKEAFKIIVLDKQVKAVLVNIFGGIVRCDLIAQGIIHAVSEVGINIPVVVRLEGNRATEAIKLLNQSGFNILTAVNLQEAAEKAVASIHGQQGQAI